MKVLLSELCYALAYSAMQNTLQVDIADHNEDCETRDTKHYEDPMSAGDQVQDSIKAHQNEVMHTIMFLWLCTLY